MKERKKISATSSTESRRKRLRWSHVLFFAAGALLAVETMVMVDHFRVRSAVAQPSSQTVDERGPIPKWGLLEKVPLALDRPDEFLQQDEPVQEIVWFFGGITPAALTNLVVSAGLTESQQQSLLEPNGWQVSNRGIAVRPALPFVRGLSESARQRIYSVLAKTEENIPQRFPFTFRGVVDELLADVELTEPRAQDFRQMVYRQGDVTLFSDLPYFRLTASAVEVRSLMRQLTRVPTLFLKLRVPENANVKGLVDYWGRNEDARLLLESLARVPGGSTIHIEHFLPPVPRSLLYKYPHPKEATAAKINCVWSSMNFFRPQPDDNFFNQEFTARALDSDYQRVPEAEAFGDLIMFHQAESSGGVRLVHMCVFIADDVVFTKNGGDLYQPWVLMQLENVRALFPHEPGMQTTVYRRKSGS